MFTGLIKEVGQIAAITTHGETAEIQIQSRKISKEAELGDSIAVNGACLTVSAIAGDVFCADISSETISRTSFAEARPGDLVNLEPSLRLGDKMGGHIVAGHIDGVGVIERIEGDGEFCQILFRFPQNMAPYIAEKGSICIEGISLTVTTVEEDTAGAAIIPVTLQHTNLRVKNPGDKINLEADMIARYVERLLSFQNAHKPQGLTMEKLREYGYHIE